MKSKIKITNNTQAPVTIDIEGVIGVLEEMQFSEPDTRVATYEKFKEQITKIKQINAKEIIVNIRSAGGNVNDAILIYEALRGLNAQITTRCYGYVASAATIIAQAASDKRREVSASALYLIHNSIGNIEGNSDEMKQTLNLLQITDKTIAEIYAQRANKDIEIYTNLMDENGGNGRWISPKETLEYGLTDKIIKIDANISNSAEIIETLGLPPIPNEKQSDIIPIMRRLNLKWKEITQLIRSINQEKTEKNITKKTSNEVAQNNPISISKEQIKALEMKEKIKQSTQTNTSPKEDPAMDEIGVAANTSAYQMDIKQFKQ